MSEYAPKVHALGPDKMGFENGGEMGLIVDGAIHRKFPVAIRHVATAAQATANAAVIATGLTAVTGFICQVYRANVNVSSDAVVTISSGNVSVADGSTFNLAENDVIQLLVW